MRANYVDETVTSSLGTDQRTTPGSALTSEHALPPVAVIAVCTEEPSDLTARHTNITSRNVGIGTDVLAQLTHERNAELADLVVGLALGVEVGTTLTTTNVNCHY
jgi:hypothetical protein